jgi:hypothetical protein
LRRHISALLREILQILAFLAIKRNIGEARFFGAKSDSPPFTIVPQNRRKRNLFCPEIAKNSLTKSQKKQEIPVLTIAR